MSNTFANIDINQINSLISQAQQNISCDSNCQSQNQVNSLKQKYLDAQENKKTAGYKLDKAQKNYYVASKGQQYYTDFENNKLTKEGTRLADEFISIFNNQIDVINLNLDSYTSLYNNYDNVYELYSYYQKNMNTMRKQLKNERSDVLTNERKTYYEDQGIESLNILYYYVLLTVYVIVVLGFVGSVFMIENSYSLIKKILLIVVLILLPFISTKLLTILIIFFRKIYNLLPRNINLSL